MFTVSLDTRVYFNPGKVAGHPVEKKEDILAGNQLKK
jgi:hypothetical protein